MLSQSFSQLQHKSTPVLHRVSHRLFPCISHAVVLEVELGQDRVDLQRLSDRLGTLWSDFVVLQSQGGHDRHELQVRRDEDGVGGSEVLA